MYSFIVLGIIPGTDIQLSFQAWLGIATVVWGIATITWIELRRRSLVPAFAFQERQPVHASQLHRR